MQASNKVITINNLGLLILIYLVVFLKLGSFHMRWWDESLFAVNTYEMLQNGKYFSLYFDGAPDLFNTKPPLTIWLQLLSVKAFGYNELALRLPSALAAAFSVLLVFNFILKKFSILWAWLSALVLLTSFGFIHYHTARTADSDSLLCFFVLAGNIYFLKYLMEGNRKHILVFILFISLGFATKMYASLLFAPAYLIILIQRKKLFDFIWNKYFLSGTALFLFSIIGLALLRENDTPGYIHELIFKDAGRLFKVVEDHKESTTYYLDNFFSTRFATWFVLLLIGAVISFFVEDKTIKLVLTSLVTLLLTYLIIITFSITKLEWYDMALYPIMAIIASYPLFFILEILIKPSNPHRNKLILILTIVFFIYPYHMMFYKSQSNQIPEGEKQLEANEHYLFEKINGHKDLNGITVYYSGYNGSLIFYKYRLLELKQKIELNTNGKFRINDLVLVSNDSLIVEMQEKYQFSILDQLGKAQLVQINRII